jgi:hypothetical protein
VGLDNATVSLPGVFAVKEWPASRESGAAQVEIMLEFQSGIVWERLPEGEWPAREETGSALVEEEKEKGVMAASCNIAAGGDLSVGKVATLNNTMRVWGYVSLFLCKVRRKTTDRLQAVEMDSLQTSSGPSPFSIEMAKAVLVEEAQEGLNVVERGSLVEVESVSTEEAGCQRTHLVVGGHMATMVANGYVKEELIVLDFISSPEKLCIEGAHPTDSGGLDSRVLKSRKKETERRPHNLVVDGPEE